MPRPQERGRERRQRDRHRGGNEAGAPWCRGEKTQRGDREGDERDRPRRCALDHAPGEHAADGLRVDQHAGGVVLGDVPSGDRNRNAHRVRKRQHHAEKHRFPREFRLEPGGVPALARVEHVLEGDVVEAISQREVHVAGCRPHAQVASNLSHQRVDALAECTEVVFVAADLSVVVEAPQGEAGLRARRGDERWMQAARTAILVDGDGEHGRENAPRRDEGSKQRAVEAGCDAFEAAVRKHDVERRHRRRGQRKGLEVAGEVAMPQPHRLGDGRDAAAVDAYHGHAVGVGRHGHRSQGLELEVERAHLDVLEGREKREGGRGERPGRHRGRAQCVLRRQLSEPGQPANHQAILPPAAQVSSSSIRHDLP